MSGEVYRDIAIPTCSRPRNRCGETRVVFSTKRLEDSSYHEVGTVSVQNEDFQSTITNILIARSPVRAPTEAFDCFKTFEQVRKLENLRSNLQRIQTDEDRYRAPQSIRTIKQGLVRYTVPPESHLDEQNMQEMGEEIQVEIFGGNHFNYLACQACQAFPIVRNHNFHRVTNPKTISANFSAKKSTASAPLKVLESLLRDPHQSTRSSQQVSYSKQEKIRFNPGNDIATTAATSPQLC
ncbi:hypothetical protein R3P38DRAFT_3510263 [Favolaschia claudopus]|uniref:Uncharacterized protein n=1 Tax=Favolaschia claudopus TaxID=2862362 RepID=A0AAW0BU88_9AGAR